MSALVRLRSNRGSDEINISGISYRPSPWGTFRVPADDVATLGHAGFYVAHETILA
jgi:hypothetical protein